MKRPLLLINLLVAIVLFCVSAFLPITTEGNEITVNAMAYKGYLPAIFATTPTVVPSTTKVFDDTTLQNLISISSDGTAFTFGRISPTLQSLKSGDVIVANPSTSAPNGFLRKVEVVTTQNNQVIVQTSGATLEDAIIDGSTIVSEELTPDDVSVSELAEGVNLPAHTMAVGGRFVFTLDNVVLYDNDGIVTTTNDQVRADGKVTIGLAYDFNMEIKSRQLQTFMFKQVSTETAELKIHSEVEMPFLKKEKEIARHQFKPIITWIGPVPLVLVPVLIVNVGVDGSIRVGVSAGVTQDLTMTAGVRYAESQWSPISDFSNTFAELSPTLTTSLRLKGYTAANLTLQLYGVTGPKVKAEPYLELEADVTAVPWWQLYGGLKVSAGAEMRIFSQMIGNYEITVVDYRQMLASAQRIAQMTRVSFTSDGGQTNKYSRDPSISNDGRYVAFMSGASNLVPRDTNEVTDIFVHDRQTRQTTRVSFAGGGEANQTSVNPSISGDGNYVVFWSEASNLVINDTNGLSDIFVYDQQTKQIARIRAASEFILATDAPSVSNNGRYIAFSSEASDLVSGDTNQTDDVFVHDRQTGQTTRVSVSSGGIQADGPSWEPTISEDGRYIAFQSFADNLVGSDTNDSPDMFMHDRQTGQTTRVSVASDGSQANDWSYDVAISGNGRYVTFTSKASNLVSNDTNPIIDLFVHDRETRQTVRLSVGLNGTQANADLNDPVISDDGRYIAFYSWASNLVNNDTNGVADVFVYDRQIGRTIGTSLTTNGLPANERSFGPSVSANGRYVAFYSSASNLVNGDTNGHEDVFVSDYGSSSP